MSKRSFRFPLLEVDDCESGQEKETTRKQKPTFDDLCSLTIKRSTSSKSMDVEVYRSVPFGLLLTVSNHPILKDLRDSVAVCSDRSCCYR